VERVETGQARDYVCIQAEPWNIYEARTYLSFQGTHISFNIIINAKNEIFKTVLIYIDMKNLERIDMAKKLLNVGPSRKVTKAYGINTYVTTNRKKKERKIFICKINGG